MGEITIVPASNAETVVTVGGDTIRIAPCPGGPGAGGAAAPAPAGGGQGSGGQAGQPAPPIFVNPPFMPLIAAPFADRLRGSGRMTMTFSAAITSEAELGAIGETLRSCSRDMADWHVVLTMPGDRVDLDEIRRHLPLDQPAMRITLLPGRADGG